MEVSITWNKGEAAHANSAGVNRAIFNTAKKAGRDSVRALKAAATRSVRFRKKIPVRFVNDSMPVTSRSAKDLESLEWTMRVEAKPIPVVQFPNRQVRRGVTVAINAGGRKLIKHAFVATMKSGHTGVFMRRGKSRLPIDELYSTRVIDVFEDNGMIDAVTARARDTWDATWDRVLPLELDKIGKS
jgi:hypothetical protein